MSPLAPEISVVIASYRRETRLRFALEALAAQTIDPSRFEVIVVRAEGEAETALADAPAGVAVSFERSPSRGAAAQRNYGWRAARAPLVAFTDDDCRPSPGWLAALLRGELDSATMISGPTLPDPDEVQLLHGYARSIRVEGPSPWYPSCNLTFPRVLLERTGGFDEEFEGAWGEDTDLALRAIELGSGHRFEIGALVWHAVHPRGFCGALTEAITRKSLPRLIARHPRLRSELRWGLFIRGEGPEVAAMAAGLAVAGRRPRLAVLLVGPWVLRKTDLSRLRPWSLARQLTRLPGVAVVDLTHMVVTAREAVRARVRGL